MLIPVGAAALVAKPVTLKYRSPNRIIYKVQ